MKGKPSSGSIGLQRKAYSQEVSRKLFTGVDYCRMKAVYASCMVGPYFLRTAAKRNRYRTVFALSWSDEVRP